MYCIIVAFQVFKSLGYSDDEAWERAIDCVVFKPDEFGHKLNDIYKGERRDIIILDDASVHIGSDLYKEYSKLYRAYKQAITTVRTRTKALLYNCANPEELAKFVRESDAYQIWLSKASGDSGKYPSYERDATAWAWRRITTKMGMQRRMYRLWVDHFSCHIPNKWYKIYTTKRDKYIEQPIKDLIKEGENV